MIKHNKKVILVGKGGAGKDFLAQHLVNSNYKKDVSYTTRPPRDNEDNGIDYYFITKEEFEKKIDEGLFYEYTLFNGWYYGTTIKSWEKADLFIMTPEGISKITKKELKKCLVVYINITEEIRKYRLEKRVSSPDSVLRRLEADKKDFKNFEDNLNYDMAITEPFFNLKTAETSINFMRKIGFLEKLPNLFIVCLALTFWFSLPTIFEEYIKGNTLLTVFSFSFPPIMIFVAILNWYKFYKNE